MTIYAGLDVSDKTTHVCVVDGEGVVVRRDVVASDPDVLAKWLKRHCPDPPPDKLDIVSPRLSREPISDLGCRSGRSLQHLLENALRNVCRGEILK